MQEFTYDGKARLSAGVYLPDAMLGGELTSFIGPDETLGMVLSLATLPEELPLTSEESA